MASALVAAGCASAPVPSHGVLVAIEPAVSVDLVADLPAPAGAIYVELRVEPVDGTPFRIAPVTHADGRRPPALLELNVSWEDFRGDRPTAVGHLRKLVLDWNGSELAVPGKPACIAARLEVGATEGVLARRVSVDGRLIGVDLLREGSHSGGMVLSVHGAPLSAFRPVPPGTLEEHLQSGSPEGIFLAAASAPPERQEQVLEALIEALPAVDRAARNAVFAALLFRTGETHGTDIHRWSTWWSERRHNRTRRP